MRYTAPLQKFHPKLFISFDHSHVPLGPRGPVQRGDTEPRLVLESTPCCLLNFKSLMGGGIQSRILRRASYQNCFGNGVRTDSKGARPFPKLPFRIRRPAENALKSNSKGGNAFPKCSFRMRRFAENDWQSDSKGARGFPKLPFRVGCVAENGLESRSKGARGFPQWQLRVAVPTAKGLELVFEKYARVS